jgi:hypothetical protein
VRVEASCHCLSPRALRGSTLGGRAVQAAGPTGRLCSLRPSAARVTSRPVWTGARRCPSSSELSFLPSDIC